MNFVPSEYQKNIFDFITDGVGNAVINAKAGSGKTTTLIESMKLIPNKEKILFVAFNKAIERELSERLKGYDNVDVKTYHGLGFTLLRNKFKTQKIRLNEHKYTSFINKNLSYLSPQSINFTFNDARKLKSNLKSLVDLARFNLCQSPEEVKELCSKYGIQPVCNECDIVPLILDYGKSITTEIDYTDMIWLCIENDIKTRTYKYDYVFIDEAQDSSIMQQALIKKCFKRGTRFIAIGDEFQCINAFAGADKDAFRKFKKEPNTTLLDLPITYRCPKRIVEYVQNTSNIDIIAKEDAIEGEINFDVNPYVPKNNDMVLCRNTAHLVKLYMQYNRLNKKSYLKGRNIGDTFKIVLNQIDHDYLSCDMKSDGVFPRLYERLFDMINKEILISGVDYEEVVTSSLIMDFIDTIKALEILAEGIIWKEQLIDKIDTIFSDNNQDGVCLSTIHKAKGLESDNVYILCPSLMPSKYAKKDWEKQAEENLIYVAFTRAKKTLNFISEDLFSPNLFSNENNVIMELEYQRIRMNNALKKNLQIEKCDNYQTDKKLSKTVKSLLNTNNSKDVSISGYRKNKIAGNKMAKFLK